MISLILCYLYVSDITRDYKITFNCPKLKTFYLYYSIYNCMNYNMNYNYRNFFGGKGYPSFKNKYIINEANDEGVALLPKSYFNKNIK